jgi:hypothetical protein
MDKNYQIRYVKETRMGVQATLEREGAVVAFAQETASGLNLYWVDGFNSTTSTKKRRLSPLSGRYREMSDEEFLFEEYCASLPDQRWNGLDIKQSQVMVVANAIYEWIFENRETLARESCHLKVIKSK